MAARGLEAWGTVGGACGHGLGTRLSRSGPPFLLILPIVVLVAVVERCISNIAIAAARCLVGNEATLDEIGDIHVLGEGPVENSIEHPPGGSVSKLGV